jgi:hypothetical protein
MPNLRQHGAHAFPNQGVALARHLFEALAVKHNDAPPPILNQTRPFELACYQRYGGSIHPEHLRQEFLCQGQHVTFDSILRLKQPSGEAALHRMEGIARRRLLNLCQESFVVTRHQIPEGFAALNGCVKVQTGNAAGHHGRLHNGPRQAQADAEPAHGADHAFLANRRYLDASPIRHHGKKGDQEEN